MSRFHFLEIAYRNPFSQCDTVLEAARSPQLVLGLDPETSTKWLVHDRELGLAGNT